MKKLILKGALLVLILVAFPVASARATQCDDVFIYWEYGGPTGLLIDMDSDTPTPRTIFYTTNGSDPTHSGANPGSGTMIFYGDFPLAYGQCKWFKAICYKAGYEDSAVAYENICNPTQ